ncbi:MAG TPA: NUDIX domain-containing protein [Candidatus Paceibacterota bacterium]
MKVATIVFPVKDGQILLSEKRRGHGAGRLNGYGGKVQTGERVEAAAMRELNEESGISANEQDLEKVATISFSKGGVATFECHVFFVRAWRGDFIETEEMALPRWFAFDAVPFDKMWDSDRAWLELVLKGKRIKAKAFYNEEDTKMIGFEYEEV